MSKYPTPDREFVCACAICQEDVFEDDEIVQHPVYDGNQLDHIELAHQSCAPGWVVNNNWREAS